MECHHGLIGHDPESKFATMTRLAKAGMIKSDQAVGHFLGKRG
jgi:hypothetical protein